MKFAWRCICGTLNEGLFGESENDSKLYSVCRGCNSECREGRVIAEYRLEILVPRPDRALRRILRFSEDEV